MFQYGLFSKVKTFKYQQIGFMIYSTHTVIFRFTAFKVFC